MHAATGTGRVIAGRYELADRIGQGAMGTVWRARDLLLTRDVALKEVHLPGLISEEDRKVLHQRTFREARAAAKLNHPSVITIYDVVEADGSPWVVMELVTARSLETVLAEDGPLPPWRAAGIGEMLVGALANAHAAGIVHRDVKPGNVLLTPGGRAVLTDFGVATVDGDPGLTQTGIVVGTPGFCAPERVRGARASPASDLWSLGATLYAAVEGRGPFHSGGTPMGVLLNIVHAEPPEPRSAGALRPVIEALLRKDPARRPDAATVARMLASVASAAPAGPGGPVAAGAGPGAPGTQLAGHNAAVGRDGAAAPELAAWPRPDAIPDSAAAPEPAPALEAVAESGGAAPPGPGRPPDSAADGCSPNTLVLPVMLAPTVPPGSRPPAGVHGKRGPAPAAPPAHAAPGTRGGARARRGQKADRATPAVTVVPATPAVPGAGAAEARVPAATASGPPASPATASAGPAARPEDPGSVAPTGVSPGWARPGDRPGHRATDIRAGRRSRRRRLLFTAIAGVAILAAGAFAAVALAHSGGATPAKRLGVSRNAAHHTPLPAPGYHWYRRSPGTPGGLSVAVRDGWRARQQGTTTYLRDPVTGAAIAITPLPFGATHPLKEVELLKRRALGSGIYPGYRRIGVSSLFVQGARAGAWRFSYRNAGHQVEVLKVVAALGPPGERQAYELSATAPTWDWLSARNVFGEVLHTVGPNA